jgi:DNA-binding transcriptional LysR family regulator
MTAPLRIEAFAKAEHIVVLYFESRAELFSEQFLEKLGFKRRVVLTVPNASAAVECIPGTQLICVLPTRIVKKLANTAEFATQPAPFPCPTSEIKMAWHPKNKNDPAHRWLRDTIIDITSKLELFTYNATSS